MATLLLGFRNGGMLIVREIQLIHLPLTLCNEARALDVAYLKNTCALGEKNGKQIHTLLKEV